MSLLKDTVIRLRAPVRRNGLENRDFSILANNCWGGIVSRDRRLSWKRFRLRSRRMRTRFSQRKAVSP